MLSRRRNDRSHLLPPGVDRSFLCGPGWTCLSCLVVGVWKLGIRVSKAFEGKPVLVSDEGFDFFDCGLLWCWLGYGVRGWGLGVGMVDRLNLRLHSIYAVSA